MQAKITVWVIKPHASGRELMRLLWPGKLSSLCLLVVRWPSERRYVCAYKYLSAIQHELQSAICPYALEWQEMQKTGSNGVKIGRCSMECKWLREQEKSWGDPQTDGIRKAGCRNMLTLVSNGHFPNLFCFTQLGLVAPWQRKGGYMQKVPSFLSGTSPVKRDLQQ